MRQVGVLGAPGLTALDEGVSRLEEDHKRMRRLASGKILRNVDLMFALASELMYVF